MRLLTLTGPGGVGKTRLALAVAEEMADAFAGIHVVPLAPIRDPDLVLPTIARALDVPAGDELLAQRLAAHVGTAAFLVLLDNFEQVVEAAPTITDLLAACPGLKVLVTSRARLRVGAERVFPGAAARPARSRQADGETGSDAVALFLARARAVDPDFAPVGDEAGAVAEICRRLDGLPLAIELAAARAALLPPRAMLGRLEKRLPLLTGGARDAPARQRTMRDAIAWSHDLLSPEEQALFRRLAVFVGGFTLEAAEAVAGDAELLAASSRGSRRWPGRAWCAGSTRAGEPRYAMLETVREFGLEQLAASGEDGAVRARHAAWCLALAEGGEPHPWSGPAQGRWLDRLEGELANLRAALAWLEETGDGETGLRLAGALGGLWLYRSHRVEGRAWLERALARGGEAPTTGRAVALQVLGVLDVYLGGERAVALLANSLALWRDLGDARGVAGALLLLGFAELNQGDRERAVRLLEEAAARFEALGDRNGVAMARLELGNAAVEGGNGVQGEALLEEALALFRQVGNHYGVAGTLIMLAWAAEDRGDPKGAAARYRESLGLWGEIGTQEGARRRPGRDRAAGRAGRPARAGGPAARGGGRVGRGPRLLRAATGAGAVRERRRRRPRGPRRARVRGGLGGGSRADTGAGRAEAAAPPGRHRPLPSLRPRDRGDELRADAARSGGPAPARGRPLRPGDRRGALRHALHGLDPRPQHPRQARRRVAHRGGRLRLPARPGRIGAYRGLGRPSSGVPREIPSPRDASPPPRAHHGVVPASGRRPPTGTGRPPRSHHRQEDPMVSLGIAVVRTSLGRALLAALTLALLFAGPVAGAPGPAAAPARHRPRLRRRPGPPRRRRVVPARPHAVRPGHGPAHRRARAGPHLRRLVGRLQCPGVLRPPERDNGSPLRRRGPAGQRRRSPGGGHHGLRDGARGRGGARRADDRLRGLPPHRRLERGRLRTGAARPGGAEVHLVLTDLGPVDPAADAYQIRALADGCLRGDQGDCPSVQVSVQVP